MEPGEKNIQYPPLFEPKNVLFYTYLSNWSDEEICQEHGQNKTSTLLQT